jgi:hypothetical protein
MKKYEMENLTEEALDAFWNVVTDVCPPRETGDLTLKAGPRLDQAARDAVQEWCRDNAPKRRS